MQTSLVHTFGQRSTQDVEKEIENMTREQLVRELRLATQKTQFHSLSDRIYTEGRIVRLGLRLSARVDPRIDEMFKAMKNLDVSIHAHMPQDKLIDIKNKMMSLSETDVDSLYVVFNNVNVDRVIDILLDTY